MKGMDSRCRTVKAVSNLVGASSRNARPIYSKKEALASHMAVAQLTMHHMATKFLPFFSQAEAGASQNMGHQEGAVYAPSPAEQVLEKTSYAHTHFL